MKQFKGGSKKFGGSRDGDSGRFPPRDGGRPSFGGKPSFSRGNDRNGEMFQAVCAQCGKTCEVPFRPNGKKPVFCQDCFNKNAPSNDGFARKEYAPKPAYNAAPTAFKPREDNRANEDLKRSLDAISAKLDKLVSVIESQARPAAVQAAVPAPAKEAAKPAKAEKAAKPAAKKVVTKKVAKKK